MSKNYNTTGTFLDTRLLRDHVSKLQAERKTALRLRDSITAMQHSCDPTLYASYTPILRDVNQLIEYLDRMARLLDDAEYQATQLSQEIYNKLQDNAEQVSHISSSSIML